MKRLLLFVVLAVLALPASAHASTFAAEFGSPFATRSLTYGVTTNDFNGDGLADVAVVNGNQNAGTSNNISIFLRQVAWRLRRRAGLPRSPSRAGRTTSCPGTSAASSQPDLAVATFGTSVVAVLERNPTNNGFTQAGSYSIPQGGSSIQTADFNGDGALDLVFGSWNSASVHVLTRSGTGFSPQEPAYAVGTNPRQMAVGDYNGDRRPDLAVANWNGNSVTILLRNASSTAFVSRDDDSGGYPAERNRRWQTSTATDAWMSPLPTSPTTRLSCSCATAANDGFTTHRTDSCA